MVSVNNKNNDENTMYDIKNENFIGGQNDSFDKKFQTFERVTYSQ
jgi:hypothetical protein